jgi:hypothetical protein
MFDPNAQPLMEGKNGLADFEGASNRVARCYVYFQTQNRNLGKFWRVLEWNMLVYYMDIFGLHFCGIWYILWLIGIFCGNLVYYPPFW